MKKVYIFLLLIVILIIFLSCLNIFYFKENNSSKFEENNSSKFEEYNSHKFEEYNSSKLKILNLVLYSPNDEYIDMYKLTNKYYKKYKNVDTLYYHFGDLNNFNNSYKYDKDNNILIIKGKENYLPGILDKTIKAFKYVEELEKIKGYNYDYIVRSNISTIIDFDKLNDKLIRKPIDYGGGIKLVISKGWRDGPSGIDNDRYEGVQYASGTSIIISRNLLDKILKNSNLIDYTVIDDVSIGDFIKKNFPHHQLHSYEDYFLQTNENIIGSDISNYIFFRNRNNDRKTDLKIMKYIIDLKSK